MPTKAAIDIEVIDGQVRLHVGEADRRKVTVLLNPESAIDVGKALIEAAQHAMTATN